MLDTSAVANGKLLPGGVRSLNDKLLTPVENRPRSGTADGGCVRSAPQRRCVEMIGV